MKMFSNYSKWLVSFVFAALFSSSVFVGCAVDDSSNPSAANHPMVAAQALDQSDLGQAIAIQNRHTDELMAVHGVVGTGTGINEHGSPVIYVFTSKPGVESIPSAIEGLPTRIEHIGEVEALASGFKGTYRSPMYSGVSVGNDNECASGTIGCVVTKNGHNYLLSNNHVFARMNAASLGERIDQPGRYDKRCGASGQVASLSQFVPINFNGGNNTIDCAIAEISSGIGTVTSQMALGTYTPTATPVAATVGMTVKKTGRTTGLTNGTVSAINVTVNVNYGSGRIATFINQVYISGRFSAGGDSGSLIVDKYTNDPVALLFAGSSNSTIGNPISDVLTTLGVTVVPN